MERKIGENTVNDECGGYLDDCANKDYEKYVKMLENVENVENSK